ncbi:MAG TPA: hypothetical protein VF074_10715, partial [Pyrinomonadaceae bacterium]
ATSNEATLTVVTPTPVIFTGENTDVAIALDSVFMIRDPFLFTNPWNFSADNRTRLSLFVENLELAPGEDASAVTVRAEDAQMNVFPMAVEHLSKTTVMGDEFFMLVVRLPDNLPTGQSLLVSVTLRGQTSNKAGIRIR